MKPYTIYVGEAGVTLCNAAGAIIDCFQSIEEGIAAALDYVGDDPHSVVTVSPVNTATFAV